MLKHFNTTEEIDSLKKSQNKRALCNDFSPSWLFSAFDINIMKGCYIHVYK